MHETDRVTVHDTIAEDDRLCVRWSCTANHTGPGLGVDPTSSTIHATGISLLRVAGGEVVERWQNWDMLALMQQTSGGSRPATYIAAS